MSEYLISATAFLIVSLISAVAWFVRSGFTRNDTSNARVEGKVDALTAATNQIALNHGQAIAELGLRVGSLEREVACVKPWREDITGFLASLGFRKRDGSAQ